MEDFASTLARKLENGLRGVLGTPSSCAMLLYRDNVNVGDAAIWVGQNVVLNRLGFTLSYASIRDGFSAEALRSRMPAGPILISGGGSLGSQWPNTQAFKEKVIQLFPDRQIVIMPQSGHFADDESLSRFSTVASDHEQLTVVARDDATLKELSSVDCDKRMLPDAAFALWDYRPVQQGRSASGGKVTYLLRRDGEAPGHIGKVGSVDWGDPVGLKIFRRLERKLIRGNPVALSNAKAKWRVNHGLSLLSGSSAVVTDRLHGLVLSRLLDIPTVVLDNSWGKVSAFHTTWFRDDPKVRWAENLDEASDAVQNLL